MKRAAWLLGVAVVLAGAWAVRAEDWPQWRGPRGDGISKETLPATWPADGLKKVWSAQVGLGYSSPIAVGPTVYMFGAEDGKEKLFALAVGDGKQLWKQGYKASGLQDGGYKGTRATPTFEDGKIYTIGGGGQVVCWDAANEGKILWKVDVFKEIGAENLGWGASSSPLIVGGRVYMQGGKGGPVAVGIDKKTGKIDWKSEAKGLSGYAHPIMVEVEGVKQLVIFGGKAVYGIALESGKTLWEEKWMTSYDVNATTPVYRDGNLMVSSGYGHGAMMLRLTASGAKKVWENKEMQSRFPGIILDGDYVYGNSEGKLKCLHWPDGAVAWQDDVKINVGGSVVKAGDKLLVLSERGKLYVLKADGVTHEKVAEATLFDADQVWATPLLYGGKLYAKGGEELACFDLEGK